jgi:hypothetical protein
LLAEKIPESEEETEIQELAIALKFLDFKEDLVG